MTNTKPTRAIKEHKSKRNGSDQRKRILVVDIEQRLHLAALAAGAHRKSSLLGLCKAIGGRVRGNARCRAAAEAPAVRCRRSRRR